MAFTEDDIMKIIGVLKKKVDERGGKVPRPDEDLEFYVLIDTLVKEYGMKLKDIAETLKVSYGSLRSRYSEAKREIAGNSMGVPESEEKPREVLGSLERMVYDSLKRHSKKSIDALTAETVSVITKVGMEFFDKHYSWCKENGREPVQCLNEAMLFFRKYKDRIEELEEKLNDLRNLVIALLSEDKDFLLKSALVESFKYVIEEELAKGNIKPFQVYDLLKSVERYLMDVIGVR